MKTRSEDELRGVWLRRLLRRVDVVSSANGCWLWTSTVSRDGYGKFTGLASRRPVGVSGMAHRAVYQLMVGPVPDETPQLDHICREPRCCNPRHLEPVTGLENARRMPRATKTHCVNGHEFTPENTYRWDQRGQRSCRACNRDCQRRRAEARRRTR